MKFNNYDPVVDYCIKSQIVSLSCRIKVLEFNVALPNYFQISIM